MFNFVKELHVIGVISSAFGKITSKFCGSDLLERMSNKERNFLSSDILKTVENLHSTKILDPYQIPFDDAMVCGFLLLAKKVTPNDSLKHQIILLGLMNYINAALNQNGNISVVLLTEAKEYLSMYKLD